MPEIPDFCKEKVGQSSRSVRPYHDDVVKVCLLILLATQGRKTSELTAKMGRYMQNYMWVQRMMNIITIKSLR